MARLVLVAGDVLHLVAHGLNVLLGDRPGLQRVLGPVDGVDVGLHVATRIEQEDFRHGRGVGLGPLEHLFIEPQLREGVEQVVLLVAHVNAEEHRQQVSLLHRVARLQVAAQGRNVSRRTVRIVDLADLHHFGRREADAHANQSRGIEGRRAGHHQGPRPGRLLGDGDLIDVAFANAQRLPHLFRHEKAVRFARHQFDGQRFFRRRVRFLRDRSRPGQLHRPKCHSERHQDCQDGQQNSCPSFERRQRARIQPRSDQRGWRDDFRSGPERHRHFPVSKHEKLRCL